MEVVLENTSYYIMHSDSLADVPELDVKHTTYNNNVTVCKNCHIVIT